MLSLVLVSSPALQMAPLATVPAARTAAPLMQGMMAPYDAPSNAEFHRNRRRSYRNWGRNGRRNWGNGYGGADSNWYPMGNFGTGSINSYGHDRYGGQMDRYGSGSIDGYQRDRMGYQGYDGRVYEQDRYGPYRQGYGSRYNRRMAGPWDDGPYDDYNDYYSGGYNMNGYGGYGGLGGGYMGGPGMMRSGGGWNYNNRGQTSMFGGQDDWYPSDRYASPCEADMYD